MQTNQDSIKKRWGDVDEMLSRWLQERQELIGHFVATKELKTSPTQNKTSQGKTGQRLEQFCEVLVDYVSAGHFEIYDKLICEAQDFDDTDSIRLAQALYPKIGSTTELALEFNDRYENSVKSDSLDLDLAAVGDVLATRFALEDRLIEDIHTAHRTEVA